MRQLFYILSLVFILLCPSGLACLFFAWQKYQVKEAVKMELLAGMDASELTELKFSKADVETLLDWEEEREFEYQGQMYDVVGTSIEGDSIRYICYRDHAESRLKKELQRLLCQPLKDDPATAGNTQRLINFFQSLFFLESAAWVFPGGVHSRASFFYTSPFGAPVGPPPVPPPEV
ncbi:MAG: hypothetical protein KDD19_16250 [Phaeodactylibacter sp.]|nr:hypothetical protein [Phaeodactylibacter sp.]MCB9048059.1 hypothetical protein [Lewinellaceae bacterium]